MTDFLSSPQGIQKTFGTLSQLARNSGNGTLSRYSGSLGNVGNVAGVLGGIQRGGVGGYGSSVINAGQLAGRTGYLGNPNSGLNRGVGDAANVLGIYNGIKQGGVGGYGGAAVNAAQLGSKVGAFGNASGAIGSAAGYAAIPLSLYNEVKNWESGNTGSDALAGASTGAAIGSVVPVVGTAIGALVGGAAGALSSAFGPGRVDPENANWNSYTGAYNKMGQMGKDQGATPDQIAAAQKNLTSQVSNPYGALAGYFDLRSQQVKGNNPLYSQYGRMGEGKFTNDMISQINDASKAGKIGPNDDASSIYSKVVQPWEDSWGKGASTDANSGAMQGLLTQMISQYEGGQASNNWLGAGGDKAFANLGKPPKPNVYGPDVQQTPTIQPQVRQMGITGKARGGVLRRHFDEGGDVGDDYSGPTYDPGQSYDFNSLFSGGSGNAFTDYSNQGLGDIQAGLDQNQLAINDANYGLDQFDQRYGLNGAASPKGGALSQLKTNATGGNGLSGLLKAYAPLIPLIQGAVQSSNTKKPTLPAGMSNSVGPMPTPNFHRQQVAAPTNTGAPMSQQDWYTYGQRPEAQFYSNNQVPLVGQAKGGSTPPPLRGSGALGQATGVQEFNSAASSHVPDDGTGDGTSDDVPAKLSAGEYVFDANTVSMLGNGSNKAGAQRLDQLRANLRKHAAKPMSKGKQFMKAKPPEAYMSGGKGAK